MHVDENGAFSRWTTGITSNVSHPKKELNSDMERNASRSTACALTIGFW